MTPSAVTIAGEEELGDDLDDPGAADPGDARRARRSRPWRANAGSSDQASTPMTRNRGSSVSRSIRTRSMAPGAARWPPLIWAPSNAGPVGLEAARSRSPIAQHDLGVRPDVDDQGQRGPRGAAPRRGSRRRCRPRRARRCTAARRPARPGGREGRARPRWSARRDRSPGRTARRRAASGRCRAAGDA